MSRIRLSPAAADDLRDIRVWTRDAFGLAQSMKVTRRIFSALETLTGTPLTGRLEPEYDPPGRSFRYRLVMRSS